MAKSYVSFLFSFLPFLCWKLLVFHSQTVIWNQLPLTSSSVTFKGFKQEIQEFLPNGMFQLLFRAFFEEGEKSMSTLRQWQKNTAGWSLTLEWPRLTEWQLVLWGNSWKIWVACYASPRQLAHPQDGEQRCPSAGWKCDGCIYSSCGINAGVPEETRVDLHRKADRGFTSKSTLCTDGWGERTHC